jgi:hypothetical protein
MVQDLIVGLIVALALGVVLFRIFRAIWPPKGQSACPSCASGDVCGEKPVVSGSPSSGDVKPLILIRHKTR